MGGEGGRAGASREAATTVREAARRGERRAELASPRVAKGSARGAGVVPPQCKGVVLHIYKIKCDMIFMPY